MKKIITVLLATLTVFTLSISTFAAENVYSTEKDFSSAEYIANKNSANAIYHNLVDLDNYPGMTMDEVSDLLYGSKSRASCTHTGTEFSHYEYESYKSGNNVTHNQVTYRRCRRCGSAYKFKSTKVSTHAYNKPCSKYCNG